MEVKIRKSSFAVLMLETVSGMLFAMGMCMVLLPQWNSFYPGIVFGGIGIAMGLVTLAIWKKWSLKSALQLSGRSLAAIAVGILGALLLGVGLCLCLVWNQFVMGILLGTVGILGLLSLIPIIGGLKD